MKSDIPAGYKMIPGMSMYAVDSIGNVYSVRRRGLIKQRRNAKGFWTVSIQQDCGEYKGKRVHNLVALAFIGDRPEGFHVAHLDGDKDNNNADNLTYCTPRENIAHKKAHGTMVNGEKHYHSKLKVEDVMYIMSSNESSFVLAKKFGVVPSAIQCVRRGKNWSEVTGLRNVPPKDYHGENHPLAKLSNDEAKIIKESNESSYVLAKRYGVSPFIIQKIKNGKSYVEALKKEANNG